jgi:hypothetical protein
MNDNDKPSDTETGLLEIIETFAPGYHAALAMFATTQREVMVLKLVIVACHRIELCRGSRDEYQFGYVDGGIYRSRFECRPLANF